jgi:fibronectin type 3 domain-containing protein
MMVAGRFQRLFMRKNTSSLSCATAFLLAAHTLSPSGAADAQTFDSNPLAFAPYADTWPDAQERWWDIASHVSTSGRTSYYNQYQNWVTQNSNGSFSPNVPPKATFRYSDTSHRNVTVTYQTKPNDRYFVGQIVAKNLKPNFAYQVKLVGKPVYGTSRVARDSSGSILYEDDKVTPKKTKGRGFGPFVRRDAFKSVVTVANGHGEDWANERLGKAGRWWNDADQGYNTNATTDTTYANSYANSSPTDTIYGYLFMGVFVTDAQGNAKVNINGRYSYHITGQDWQGYKDAPMLQDVGQDGYPKQAYDSSTGKYYFPIKGFSTGTTEGFYGYGPTAPSSGDAAAYQTGKTGMALWYQYENSMTSSRPKEVALPAGRYRCRIMLTEESFHNNYGATSGDMGGRWASVLATEDYVKDANGRTIYNSQNVAQPDLSPANDIVFDIKDANGAYVSAPATPTGVKATPGFDSDGVALVTVNWNAASGANTNYYYRIQRRASTESSFVPIAGGVNTKGVSYVDNTVQSGVTYYYRVFAVNSGVEGGYSIEASTTRPIKPASLMATAGDGQVALSWAASEGALSYNLLRSTSSGTGYQKVATGLTTLSHTDKTVSNGTTYYYVVLAVNSAGESESSPEASAKPQVAPPTAPSGLSAKAVAHDLVSLKWKDNSSNESGFRIERSRDGEDFELATIVDANVTTLCDSVPVQGIYYYRILAFNDGGNSDYADASSDYPSADTGGSLYPVDAPQNLKAVAGDGQVTLSWTAICGATSYNIKRKAADEASYINAKVSGTPGINGTLTEVDDTVKNGATYEYVISANSAGGESENSAPVSATPQAPPPPTAPTNFVALADSSTQITLTWADNSGDESGFKIARSKDGATYFSLTTTEENATSFQDQNLEPGTRYSYRLSATSDNGDSAAATATATTLSLPVAPLAPSGLLAIAASSSQIDLRWVDNSNNETGFTVERWTNNGPYTHLVTTVPNETRYSDVTASAGASHRYRIYATNNGTNSGYSIEAVVPIAPTTLVVAKAGAGKLKLTWADKSSNEDGFIVERSLDNSSFVEAAQLTANTTSFIDVNLKAKTHYFYRVRAAHGISRSASTNTASATP